MVNENETTHDSPKDKRNVVLGSLTVIERDNGELCISDIYEPNIEFIVGPEDVPALKEFLRGSDFVDCKAAQNVKISFNTVAEDQAGVLYYLLNLLEELGFRLFGKYSITDKDILFERDLGKEEG